MSYGLKDQIADFIDQEVIAARQRIGFMEGNVESAWDAVDIVLDTLDRIAAKLRSSSLLDE